MTTKEQRATWRREFDGRMMTSAIWEYCPPEFGELLDDVDRLEQQRDMLLAALQRALPWLGRLIHAVAPQGAIGAMRQAEAAIKKATEG